MKLKINIKYSTPEADVLEIGFYRGEELLQNVLYDIKGLTENELFELKQEAAAKFAACFPAIPLKDVMKGFAGVDSAMYELYRQTFNPRGAGRKQGKKIGKIKEQTVMFARRVTPAEKEKLEKFLEIIRMT